MEGEARDKYSPRYMAYITYLLHLARFLRQQGCSTPLLRDNTVCCAWHSGCMLIEMLPHLINDDEGESGLGTWSVCWE
jgi:hypothetical protein